MNPKPKLQDLFYLADEELRILQQELYHFEKEAFGLIPLLQNLENKINNLQDQINPTRHPRLFRRLSQIRFFLRQLQYRHSYKEELFSKLSQAISITRKRLPYDIIPFRQIAQQKAIIYPPSPKPKITKLPPTQSLCFYRLQNGSMFFIIPAKNLLFQATVPNREKITLKLSHGTYVFNRLPGDDPLEKKPETKKAFLFYYQKQYLPLLADNYLGKLFLSLKLFRQKIHYLTVAENWHEAYFDIEGKRYYLLKPYLKLLQDYEKSLEILA